MEKKKMMETCLRFMETHLEEIEKVSDIATAMGYSESYFSRWFQKEMQMSVMDYVKKRRLIKASDAILHGEKIIDVALRFGWQTHSGFTKSFKHEFGFAPALLKAIILEMNYLGGNAMSHIFYGSTELHATKEQLFEILKKEIAQTGIENDTKETERVYREAFKAYEGMKRYSGDEYVTHPLNVAIILAQMSAEIYTIYAGLFWDVLREEKQDIDDLKEMLPVRTIEVLEQLMSGKEQGDEAVMVQLADRLHNMRTIEFLDENKRKVKAKETLEIILPFAKRIENEKLFNELNDLALKYWK